MAGERKGITYEAVVKIALQELVRKRILTGQVFWNERPDSMTIEPDLTVGTQKDRPTHVFLVTHSGSAKNSDMKFWRNIGELAEAKIRLPAPAHVYSIVFDAIIKEDLKVLQSTAFDGQLLVDDSAYGQRLLSWVKAISQDLPKDPGEKVDAIRELMNINSLPYKPLSMVNGLAQDLRKLVKVTRPDLDGLWSMERKRPPGRAPAARDTFLRRGVGKLLLLDHADDIDSSGRFKKSVSKITIASLKTMGLAEARIGGPRITDPQMLWAIRNLPPETLAELHKARALGRVAEWVETLRTLANVDVQVNYLTDHWRELTTGRGLFRKLKLCHSNPNKLCPSAAPAGSRSVWLFHLISEWIKLASGTRTAFGLAVLVEDLDRLSRDRGHRIAVRKIVGREPIWLAKHTLGLGLTDWHSTASKQTFAFTDYDLARVADALARRLIESDKPDPPTDTIRVTEAIVQTVLEAKLLTYRNFKPFEVLLEAGLRKAGFEGVLEVAVRACFAEAASAAGAKLDPRSSGTTVMRVKNTLIDWQSASDEGRDHKRKELCGRAPALRYTWSSIMSRFVNRSSTDKLILLVDGTWRQEDLDALTRAGWDDIFYPDEMDSLVKAIV